jgi:hypothetical protein
VALTSSKMDGVRGGQEVGGHLSRGAHRGEKLRLQPHAVEHSKQCMPSGWAGGVGSGIESVSTGFYRDLAFPRGQAQRCDKGQSDG